ncbi:MAG: hypothetical protein WCA56_13520 [Xanthobacteraceae bacterium]|jgi:hypothetical protein
MTTTRTFTAVLLLAAATATPALAQAPQVVHGAIDKVEGSTVLIKQAQGPDVSVKLLDNANVFGVKAATLADVKPNDFIGVGAMPQPDGSQKAIQVTIFAPSQRGTGEGFRPWDRPGSTMTNGTAGDLVSSVNGRVVMVKYKGGEQKVVIGPDAKIRMYVAGTRDELKPGAQVSVFRPEKAADGSLQTGRINVGIGDMMP